MTDDQGAYRVYGLEPGEYLVVTPTTQIGADVPEETNDRRPASEHRTRVDLAYPTLFYSSSRYSQLALPVQLTSGEVRYAVNFQWTPVPARSVSGRLTGDTESVANQTRQARAARETAKSASEMKSRLPRRRLTERFRSSACRPASTASRPAAHSDRQDFVEINAVDPATSPNSIGADVPIAVDRRRRQGRRRQNADRASRVRRHREWPGSIGRVSIVIVPAAARSVARDSTAGCRRAIQKRAAGPRPVLRAGDGSSARLVSEGDHRRRRRCARPAGATSATSTIREIVISLTDQADDDHRVCADARSLLVFRRDRGRHAGSTSSMESESSPADACIDEWAVRDFWIAGR